MLKFATRWMLLGYIWNKYHRIIKTLSLYLVLITLIVTLHSEYISYCKAIEQQACNIGFSYIVKWVSVLFVAVVLAAWINFPVKGKTLAKKARLEPSCHAYKEDKFDAIRTKVKLVSRGDRIIQNKPDRCAVLADKT